MKYEMRVYRMHQDVYEVEAETPFDAACNYAKGAAYIVAKGDAFPPNINNVIEIREADNQIESWYVHDGILNLESNKYEVSVK